MSWGVLFSHGRVYQSGFPPNEVVPIPFHQLSLSIYPLSLSTWKRTLPLRFQRRKHDCFETKELRTEATNLFDSNQTKTMRSVYRYVVFIRCIRNAVKPRCNEIMKPKGHRDSFFVTVISL